jgi:threonine/homoserine/homoserine lactone efflux protein
MIGTLLTFFAVGIVALVAISIVLAVVGTVFSLAFGVVSFLLFKVAPILLLGWVVLKVLDRGKKPGELSASDREWLESGQ